MADDTPLAAQFLDETAAAAVDKEVMLQLLSRASLLATASTASSN